MTATLPSVSSAVILAVASAAAAPSSALPAARTIDGGASPTRTARGERSCGVAACITRSASSMIWAGMR